MEIQWTDSELGNPIPQQQGQYLCSRVNPVSEAQKWLQACEPLVRDAETLLVLGMGGGFHLQALVQKYPDKDIIVIEKHREIADYLGASLPKEIVVLAGSSYEDLSRSDLLKEALKTYAVVLKHPASFRLNRDYYSKLEALLTGRDPRGLQDLLKLRLELRPFFRSLKLNEQEVPSILNIEEAIKARGAQLETEGLIWLTLRELVR